MAHHVWGVHHGSLRTLELQLVPDLHLAHELRDITCRVGFDEQVEVAAVIIRGDRSVRAHAVLAINLCLDRDMLADGETEDGAAGGQLKAVATKVRRRMERPIGNANIAVLCDSAFFSFRGNS